MKKKRYSSQTGQLIREHRRKQRLTRQQLASLAGLSLPTVCRYEKGSIDPHTSNLKKVARALNIDYGELLICDSKRQKRVKKILLSKNAVAKILRDKRLEMGLSQNKLAQMTGNNVVAICRYEKGVHIPNEKNLIQLCKVLDLDLNDFYAEVIYREKPN